MDWKALYQTLSGMFDIGSCLEITRHIWETDRWCSTRENEKTARYCAQQLRQAGLSQVELLPLKADGKTRYLDWIVPRAWEADSASLCYANGEPVTDYRENPCSLVSDSPATPPEGITAQVIEPSRENPEAVRGKVLLVSDPASSWVEFAREHGAVGILSDYIRIHPGVRDSREDLYDDVIWMGMSSETVFGFHLTPRQADEMRRRIAAGPVQVHARVSSRSYDGVYYTVSAALEGYDPAAPEVLLYGHLYEPGANDNACGAAAILYLAQVLAKAVREGLLPRPKNTIRFAMGYECSGSMGYVVSHPERPLLCAMAVDMVGTEQGDNAVLGLYFDPLSNLSFCDGALYALHKLAGEPPCIHIPFKIATDSILADPSLNCPAVALCAAPALSYHSSMDRPERLEPQTLKRNALMVGTYAFGIATADGAACDFLADAIRELTDLWISQSPHPRQRRLLTEASALAMHSLSRIRGEETEAAPEFSTEPAPDWAQEAVKRIPQRITRGCLKFWNDRYCAAWNRDLNIPVFWIDGKRNLWQIAYLSAVEKGCCTDAQLKAELELLTGYFTCLTENGDIYWI